jgi:hypothetical protein
MNPASYFGAINLFESLQFPEKQSPVFADPDFDKVATEGKKCAIARGDQAEAKLFWQCQTIAIIQRDFLCAFSALKERRHYDAWCLFEHCEVALSGLLRHYIPLPKDSHRVHFIKTMVERWQQLFPYRLYFSPEFLKKKVVCSICGEIVTPRTKCPHTKGDIFDGEMCFHKVVEVELLGISVVENPVQKYSVAFLVAEDGSEKRDHYDYSNVQFVVDRLDSAFHGWEAQKTTRVLSKSDTAHLLGDTLCPCMSGKSFADCCYSKDEITVPHLQIQLSVPPSKVLPANELLF